MKNVFLISAVFLLFAQISVAQTNKVMFQIGATANYYQNESNLTGFSYTDSKLSYGLTAAIGVDSYTKEGNAKNTFAVFGSFGFLSDDLAHNYLSDQNLTYTVDSVKNSSDFQEIEFGAVVSQVFRVSFGYGWFNFYDEVEHLTTLNYYTATTGLVIPLGNLKWSVNLTALTGKDFSKTVFRPSTSIIIKLD